MPSPASETVVHEITALHEGWLISGQLIHRPDDPHALTLRFADASMSVDWTFALDLLKVGLVQRNALMGPGDVHTRRYGDDVVIVVKGTSGRKTMLLIPVVSVSKFLRAVKPQAMNFDKELEDLLRGPEADA